jgi:hypothetical protein
MTQFPKNPFDREDWFSEVVKSNDSIMSSSRKAFLQFQTKYNPQSMTKFQKVLTFFTTHTITAIVTASICLGGIATFAAQQVAPEQYKPSTVVSNLFKNNKVQQTNPNTPLVSDAQNDVISYNECGISIKYPKYVNGKSIRALNQKIQGSDDKIINIAEFNNNFDMSVSNDKNYDFFYSEIEPISVWCVKDQTNIENKELIQTKDFTSRIIESRVITNEQLQNLTGWFLAGSNKIKNIKIEKTEITDSINKSITINTDLSFEYENFLYMVGNLDDKKPLSFNQIQIQFNDVAQNIPNAEILKFDNVPTSGFLFEYDKKLELTNKDKFEFSDPSKNNTFYVIKDKAIQDKITNLSLSNGDSIIFSGQVTNSNSTINITKKEEYTITKIDKVEKLTINQNVKSSKIFGKLSYPSEGLPGVNVCAENTQSKKIICTDRVTGGWDGEPIDLNYNLELDSGEYEIYSTANNSNNTKAYYDQVSECGNGAIDYDCSQKFPNPKPVKITIAEGTKKEVNGWNWYVVNEEKTATVNLDDNTPIFYKSNIKLKKCNINGTYRIPKFYMCEINNEVFSYGFPDRFDFPNAESVYTFSGNIRRTMNDVVNIFTIVDGNLSDTSIQNTQPRTGAETKIKAVNNIDIQMGGIGDYISYTDISSNKEYTIKNNNIPGAEKIDPAQAKALESFYAKNPNIRVGGPIGTYTFSGEVLDIGTNQYEITKINEFKFKSI